MISIRAKFQINIYVYIEKSGRWYAEILAVNFFRQGDFYFFTFWICRSQHVGLFSPLPPPPPSLWIEESLVGSSLIIHCIFIRRVFACDSETSISLQGLICQTAGCLFSCWFGASVGVFLWSRFLILGSLDDRPDEVHLVGLSGGVHFLCPESLGTESKCQFSHSSRWLLLSSDQMCWAFLASAPFAQCMLCHMGCGLKERLVIS